MNQIPKFEVTIDKTVTVEAEDKDEAFDLAVDEVSEVDCTIEEILDENQPSQCEGCKDELAVCDGDEDFDARATNQKPCEFKKPKQKDVKK